MIKGTIQTARQTGKINSLTGARFVAIMLIVFSHMEFLEQYGAWGNFYKTFLHNPTMGVDFFFMLSGFGMMLSSSQRDPTGSASIGGITGLFMFGKRHVKKIYPVYVFFLLFGIPYEILYGYLEHDNSLLKEIVKCIIFLPIDLTMLQAATGHSTFSHSLNGVCWFMSSLFCIYLISPLIMQFLKRHVKTIKVAIVWLVMTIVISISLASVFAFIQEHLPFNDLVYGSPYRRVFYVIAGMLLAQIYFILHKTEQEYKWFYSGWFEYLFIGLAIIWFFIRGSVHEQLSYGVYALDMVIVAGSLYGLVLGQGFFSRIFESRKMVYLGNISMYIFLSHYNIRQYVDFIARKLEIKSLTIAIIEVVIILALTFIVSVGINYYRTNSDFAKKYNKR